MGKQNFGAQTGSHGAQTGSHGSQTGSQGVQQAGSHGVQAANKRALRACRRAKGRQTGPQTGSHGAQTGSHGSQTTGSHGAHAAGSQGVQHAKRPNKPALAVFETAKTASAKSEATTKRFIRSSPFDKMGVINELGEIPKVHFMSSISAPLRRFI
ncbi:MAG: hypothetical protein ACRC10_11545 [Thermoguttaceae bacterium]